MEDIKKAIEENMDRELGWDDEIEKESDYVLLPEGDYYFIVENFERARHGGSEKLPPCNKAIITLRIVSNNGDEITIKHNLFLHTKTEGMLSAFFVGIGQKKKGEKLKMNWNKVIGEGGMLKLGIKEYNGNKYNEVKKFYPFDEATSKMKTTTPGSFNGW